MSPEAVPTATAVERRRLADLLDSLDAAQWATPSLCDGWTVADVAAHLALVTRIRLPVALLGLVRARGDLDRMIARSAVRHARGRDVTTLVEQIRTDAGSPRRPPGTTVWDPFVDVVVHGQDIARPVGRELVVDPEHAAAALAHAWRRCPARLRTGLRFECTDVAWSGGDGTREVTGRAIDLLLTATGRAAAIDRLAGPGVPEVRRRTA